MSKVKEASWGRRFLWLGLVIIGLLLVIQLVPYGRDHTNPPVQAQAKISNPEAQKLWDQSCADCHSNLTTWPWYSNVAPVSWLVQDHVDEGRTELNLSKWQTMPEQMLRYRAASFFVRAYAPELSLGLATREEVEDSIDGEVVSRQGRLVKGTAATA